MKSYKTYAEEYGLDIEVVRWVFNHQNGAVGAPGFSRGEETATIMPGILPLCA